MLTPDLAREMGSLHITGCLILDWLSVIMAHMKQIDDLVKARMMKKHPMPLKI